MVPSIRGLPPLALLSLILGVVVAATVLILIYGKIKYR